MSATGVDSSAGAAQGTRAGGARSEPASVPIQIKASGPVEVFISFDPADEPFLRELDSSFAVLRKEGKVSVFSRAAVGAGQVTEAMVTERLNAASLIVLLVSPDFLACDACTREAARALDRRAEGNARVVPVPVRACDWTRDRIGVLAPLPKTGVPIAGWPRRDDAWLEVVSGLRPVVEDLLPGPISAAYRVQPKPRPFPGLEPFDEDRAPFFFGRDAEIVEALAMLGDTPSGHRRWLQIEGPSGAGKSSLARAGLIPAALQESGIRGAPSTFLRAVLRPGRDPVLSLAQAACRALRAHLPSDRTLDAIAADFRASETALASLLREHVPERSGFLLLVDQLEEAFTFAERAASVERFDALVARALDDKGGPLYLVTTVRTDYVARFGSLPELEARLNGEASRYHLRSITSAGLRAAIERPAEQADLEWEGDLPDRIVEDAAASKGSLPLVAHVLWALNEERDRRGGRRLSLDAYRELGGVGGALAKSADALLESLGEAGRKRAKRLLLRLVQIGRGGEEDRRQPAFRLEAVEAAGGDVEAERVLLRLSGFRDMDKPEGSRSAPPRLVAVAEVGGDVQVSLVHDALLSRWPSLRSFIDAERKGLTCRDDLEAAVQGWDAAGKPEDGLPGGAQLAYFRGAEGPSAAARRFLEAAGARERRRLRRLRLTIAGLAAGLLAFAGLAAFAVVQRAESERQRQLAESRLSDAVGVANEVALIIDEKLKTVAGAGPIQKELLERVSKLQERLLEGASESADVLRSRMTVHIQRGDVALTHDDLALAKKEYEASLGIAKRLLQADPSNARLRYDLSVSYTKLGEVALGGGDLAGARGFFAKGLELRMALSEAEPSNASLKLDLSASYNWLGHAVHEGGDLVGARGYFEKGIKLLEMLSEGGPLNAASKRELSISYNQLGEVVQAGGDLAGARGFFEKGLELRKALSAADPSNADLKRDLSVSYDRLGDVAQEGGDLAGARGYFEKGLELSKGLSEADPSNVVLKRDLSVSYTKVGDVAQAGGDLVGARTSFEKGLTLSKVLSEADPSNASLKLDVSVSYERLGDMAQEGGDLAGARRFFETCLELRRALSEADPSNADLKRAMSVSYERLGNVAKASGDLVGARRFFEMCLELRKALSAADPSNAAWQIDLVVIHDKLASLALTSRDIPAARAHHAEATVVLDRLEQSGRTEGNAMAANLRAALTALRTDLH